MSDYQFLKHPKIKIESVRMFLSLVISFFYALILSSLPNIFFRDRDNYIIYAWNFESISNSYSGLTYLFNEPLFLAYNSFLSYFFAPETVPKISVFFIAFTLAYLILKHSNTLLHAILGFSLLFFVSYTFHLQLVILRQGIATCLFLWFVHFYWGSRKFYFLCGILPFIHIVFFIIVFLLFYDRFLSLKVKDSKLKVFLIASSIFVLSFIVYRIANTLGLRQAQGEGVIDSSGGGGFILFLFVFLFLFFRGLNNVYNDKYGRVSLLGLIAYLAFYFTLPISGRVIGSFLPFIYIYIVSSNNPKVIFSAIIFFLVNAFLYIGSISNGSLTFDGVRYLNQIINF